MKYEANTAIATTISFAEDEANSRSIMEASSESTSYAQGKFQSEITVTSNLVYHQLRCIARN